MASQPQAGPTGPQNAHDDHTTGISSRLTPPRTPTPPLVVSESHSHSPSVDDITTESPSIVSALKAHRQCIIDMETNRRTVEAYAYEGKYARAFRITKEIFQFMFTYGIIRMVLGLFFFLAFMPKLTIAILLVLIPLRHLSVISRRLDPETRDPWPIHEPHGIPHYLLIVCGSGGHTGEMIRMITRSIQPQERSHRRWAMAYDDRMSYDKVVDFELNLVDRFSHQGIDPGTFDIEYFHRGRAVHQSWLTTPFTAVLCLLDIFRILVAAPRRRAIPDYQFPGVIVTDGPGSGFLFLLAAHILKVIYVVPNDFMKTIFVESWARVGSLSLSGKLVKALTLADAFIVQSPNLRGYRSRYVANMVARPARPHVPMYPGAE
ncbi:glycosyltransferase family 1 protein [Hypoxylon sp. CI-4A]|nr:glycosyltransferase family 1 protein [Hypoxylon sp. CI-4A]